MITTDTIRDNSGELREVITGLKKGEELLCKKTQRSTCGMGQWSQERYDSFVEGRIYKVDHLYNWHGVLVAYALDEDATCCIVTPQTFVIPTSK